MQLIINKRKLRCQSDFYGRESSTFASVYAIVMAGNAVEKGEVRTHHGVGDPSPSSTDPPSSQSSPKSTWASFTSTKSLLSGGTDNGQHLDGPLELLLRQDQAQL